MSLCLSSTDRRWPRAEKAVPPDTRLQAWAQGDASVPRAAGRVLAVCFDSSVSQHVGAK